jgi:hypothetical protein
MIPEVTFDDPPTDEQISVYLEMCLQDYGYVSLGLVESLGFDKDQVERAISAFRDEHSDLHVERFHPLGSELILVSASVPQVRTV